MLAEARDPKQLTRVWCLKLTQCFVFKSKLNPDPKTCPKSSGLHYFHPNIQLHSGIENIVKENCGIVSFQGIMSQQNGMDHAHSFTQ